jgi:large subunit ribosomal protein L30
MANIRIKQVKSSIDRSKDQKATLIALGLRKMNQTRDLVMNPALEGMVNKVKHLLKIENI